MNILSFSEVKLPPQRGSVSGQPVSQRPSDSLADVNHLGRSQSVDDVLTQHGRPSSNVRLVLGLFYQPQRCRLSHQVRLSRSKLETFWWFFN